MFRGGGRAPEKSPRSFSRLRGGLAKTAAALRSDVALPRLRRALDPADLRDLEDRLIAADLGPEFAARLVSRLASVRDSEHPTDALRDELLSVLKKAETKTETTAAPSLSSSSSPSSSPPRPRATLLVGVNGSGKTTTAAKLAGLHRARGRRALLVGCDSFRAAASQQLEIWAERVGCPVLPAPDGADPAALAFDGLRRAREENFDEVIFDTAGRLHSRRPLMDALAKITRALDKQMPGAPHETLLVLDAASGQTALRQTELFVSAAGVDGLILTRLDGTARGGIVVALAERFGLPVRFLGVGEGADDLVDFDAAAFVDGLLAASDDESDGANAKSSSG
ncbi:MAG: signal recognition particle-docking protein FtsY [Alphaproteobacteria bacterium]|nr:signal recognition particle-docking protein FtsY [Alphaproteobacteria bacterium]MDA8012533.1 signal recognition particle-docking protein FtsY [Alphaproteobacteria bacterium]